MGIKSGAQDLLAKMTSAPAMVKLNGWATVFWFCMCPISLAMGWLASVVYVSALSLWALVSGHLSAWQAARVEREQLSGETLNDADREWIEAKFRQVVQEEIQKLLA